MVPRSLFACLLLAAAVVAAAPAPEAVWVVDEVPPEAAARARAIWAALAPGVVDDIWPYARPPRPVTVELHRHAGFQARTEGWIQDWGVGVATDDWLAVDIDRVDREGQTLAHVLMHELGHCLLSQGTRGVDDVPAWFHEGVAQHVAREWQVRDAVSLMLDGRVPDLRTLDDRFPDQAGWADRAYRTSLLAVSRLVDWYGEGVIADLVLATRTRGSFAAGFLSVTGESVDAFAERFAGEVRLRYGWLFVLTRWPTLFVVMALGFAIGAAVKRRRDRDRLEDLPDPEAPPVEDAPPPSRLWPVEPASPDDPDDRIVH